MGVGMFMVIEKCGRSCECWDEILFEVWKVMVMGGEFFLGMLYLFGIDWCLGDGVMCVLWW